MGSGFGVQGLRRVQALGVWLRFWGSGFPAQGFRR